VQVAGLFGESDAEKARRLAAAQREQAQDAAISSLTERVSDLERALRNVTGEVQSAQHQNALLHEEIVRMKKDFDYRVCQLSAQILSNASGASADSTGTPQLNCSGFGGATAVPAAPATAPNEGSGAPPAPAPAQAPGPAPLAAEPGILGTLPSGTPLPRPGREITVNMGAVTAGSSAAPAPSGQSGASFDSAMKLLAQGRYSEAQAAFHSFAATNPTDPKAAQAVYWDGSISYVQKDYASAARAFAEEIKNYPHAELAPQSMLRLGQSLIAMKQKQEGCTTLAALHIKYPRASESVRREALASRRAAHCR
jgi:tol-pal system protein YbgF